MAQRKPKSRNKALTSREKVSAYRSRMRRNGFRLVQMWLPDTRSSKFASQAHRDALAISASASEQEDQAWLDSMSWWNSPEGAAFENSEPQGVWWRNRDRPD